MRFTDRRDFLYDSNVWRRSDTQTALLIHDEAVRAHSGRPTPRFMELDRTEASVDQLWGTPVKERVQITRQLDIPAIVLQGNKTWSLSKMGREVKQETRFWVSNLSLQKVDYFPLPGDLVYWAGYRWNIVLFDIDPKSVWGQTNVWLGLIIAAQIVPEGDARVGIDPAKVLPAEAVAGVAPVSSVTGTTPASPRPQSDSKFYAGPYPDLPDRESYNVLPHQPFVSPQSK